jgi:hypothetical protein
VRKVTALVAKTVRVRKVTVRVAKIARVSKLNPSSSPCRHRLVSGLR